MAVRMVVCVFVMCSWQRETRVRSFTPRKIIGEVLYMTPCERKLRNYNEVDKVRAVVVAAEMEKERTCSLLNPFTATHLGSLSCQRSKEISLLHTGRNLWHLGQLDKMLQYSVTTLISILF